LGESLAGAGIRRHRGIMYGGDGSDAAYEIL
jgi:hypothetical protein